MEKGYLIVNVYSDTIANPIKDALVVVSKDNNILGRYKTDEDGKTEKIELNTVSNSYSQENQDKVRPYETYDISVSALGLTQTKIENVQIFPNITSIQNVFLTSIDVNDTEDTYSVDPNTLWGNYPEQIIQNENQISRALKRVVIPNEIIVHDGSPNNSNAPNYTVNFIDYIKNVASNEIYSTWPVETIRANVLAIISFTLNRIFTEWYISRGYNFTITSTTTYDQKYSRNATIFEPISDVVDSIFNKYIRQGINIEPLLAHYKSDTTEKGYLSQWGSKYLGDKGYNALQILKFYYGSETDIYNASTSEVYPVSFKEELKIGSCSEEVYYMQNLLNYIRGSYPGIPAIPNPSGLFDTSTENAVKKFQEVFDLKKTGVVDFSTWYQISKIFVAVSKLTNSIYS